MRTKNISNSSFFNLLFYAVWGLQGGLKELKRLFRPKGHDDLVLTLLKVKSIQDIFRPVLHWWNNAHIKLP